MVQKEPPPYIEIDRNSEVQLYPATIHFMNIAQTETGEGVDPQSAHTGNDRFQLAGCLYHWEQPQTCAESMGYQRFWEWWGNPVWNKKRGRKWKLRTCSESSNNENEIDSDQAPEVEINTVSCLLNWCTCKLMFLLSLLLSKSWLKIFFKAPSQLLYEKMATPPLQILIAYSVPTR